MLDNFAQRHKNIFQSVAIFPSWLLMGYAVLLFFPALFLLFTQERILSTSTLITFLGLFVLGFITTREKSWNYIGWVALSVALGYLMFTVPYGIQLIYVVIGVVVICIASYLGFAHKNTKTSRISVLIAGLLFMTIFISHAILLANPKAFGLNVKGNEIATFLTETIQKAANMDPVEFVKTEEGRKIAIQIYHTSLFISDDDLAKIVTNNPEPIRQAQQSLLSTAQSSANNPYSYILSVYSYPLLKSLKN